MENKHKEFKEPEIRHINAYQFLTFVAEVVVTYKNSGNVEATGSTDFKKKAFLGIFFSSYLNFSAFFE